MTIAGGGAPPGGDPTYMTEAPNQVTDHYGTVGGGLDNRAGDDVGSATDAAFATVGGGVGNRASANSSTIAGGVGNIASESTSAIGGGILNVASGVSSSIAGGQSNEASGRNSTVGGGRLNDAIGLVSTVGGGFVNIASGEYSTVPGGSNNTAQGDYSFAAGHRAKALGMGSFAFADSNAFDFASFTPNAFRVRATGGVRFVTDIDDTTGGMVWSCLTGAGQGWTCTSDRNQKQNLRLLDGQAVLERLAAMPVYAWNPKGRKSHIDHYGPMAQDFHAAFGLGDDDTMIGSQDADGVALAAIQGLNAKLEAQAREIAELHRRLDALLARTASESGLAQSR